MFNTCKITVIKRSVNKDLVDYYAKDPKIFPICNKVDDNQEFMVTNPYDIPEGLCASAWADIRSYVLAIASGGQFHMMKDPNVALATCNDPFRPVIFKINRVEASEVHI